MTKDAEELLTAIRDLEQSTTQTVKQTELNRRPRLLFASVASSSECCRSAFGMWDIEENIRGVSPHRSRLKKALIACRQAIANAAKDGRLKEHDEVVSADLENIESRIVLLDVAMTKSWKDYERTKKDILTQALSKGR